ncbi:histidine phosphatase family protein [Hymenobacter sp. HSC-4F20]|uniref:phosphoglycerate mutase family protein n=1 Tax=Hymenobacter sp. HSC-4F20 TaxID=2864135 RepID=UPI001C73922E|nr:phosphoglycerate mutase family protein [Hymenobacter sp. HSC-4F20]MBX0289861.1 histidine phosphatase family protein [Hymenobacter sp. HSC-4F20]
MLTCTSSFLRPWLLSLLVLLLAAGCASSSQKAGKQPATIVYVVRHGEKETAPGLPDPPLTAAGQQRAQALADTLAGRGVRAIFSTATTRTRSTAAPLATARQLPVQPYDARQLKALAARIRREYPGQAVLVVGHSNTILETVEALGAPRPVPTVQDAEYDYLLEVRLPRDTTQAATAVARRYGTTGR